jgi:hypothetical protein
MNAPTHIAASACLAHLLLNACQGRAARLPRRAVAFGVAALAAAAACGLHLAMDSLPHRSWTALSFRLVPSLFRNDYLLREAALGLVAAVPCLRWSARRRGVVLVAMMAGMYPDVEKAAYHHGLLPRGLLLFPWYSDHWSSPVEGLSSWMQVILEVMLLAALVILAHRLAGAGRRGTVHEDPSGA